MAANRPPIRIFIADDHAIFRDGLKMMIGRLSGEEIEVCGEAANGKQLLEKLPQTNAEVVLMDIQMPVMGGVEATRTLKQSDPALPVIALSSFADHESIANMIEAGASGYLLKNVEARELLHAVRTVMGGGQYYTDVSDPEPLPPWRNIDACELSERELQVIRLLCKGCTNKEIARALNLSIRTVEGHRSRIMIKLSVRHSSDIVTYAVKHGIYYL